MLFNSLEFLLFFPLTVGGYFLLPNTLRNYFLLAASCFFYMFFNPVYILILFYTIAVDYIAAIQIEKNLNKASAKRNWLWASLFANIGALVLFKYADFLLDTFSVFLHVAKVDHSFSAWHILLPIGLSFHTFQAISYVVEVYKGKQNAEKNLLNYALYVMFFPQLVAGPIERPQRLLHQFRTHQKLQYENLSLGLKWMIWGFFKKVVVADNLALIVDKVYDDPLHQSGWPLILATVLFAFQIYGDFSGYSDIAKGTAKILGFDLMINFNLPYFAKSVSEFWKRWHISLSQWFRDYVFIPMGGSRQSLFQNIMLTFALSGLWHGANVNFIIWGLLNGLFVYMHKKLSHFKFKIFGWVQIIFTFLLIDFSWIFFRSKDFGQALHSIGNLFSNLSFGRVTQLGIERHHWGIALAMLSFMLAMEAWTRKATLIGWWHSANRFSKVAFLNLLLFLIVFFGVFEHRSFIYFQF